MFVKNTCLSQNDKTFLFKLKTLFDFRIDALEKKKLYRMFSACR